MLISFLNYPLVLVVTLHGHLYDLFLVHHLLELDLLFFLRHLNKNLVRNEGEGDALVTVPTGTAYSMDIRD